METLNRLQGCYDDLGQRTQEGDRIYQDCFIGEKAWFSNSSATEQQEFKKELSFNHPENMNETLFCPWHGKFQTTNKNQIRIHFSWPVSANEPLYVVYIGSKITKR